MGYGLIKCIGQKIELIQFGVIHLSKYKNHELKLQKIFQRISGLIDEYLPDEMESGRAKTDEIVQDFVTYLTLLIASYFQVFHFSRFLITFTQSDTT